MARKSQYKNNKRGRNKKHGGSRKTESILERLTRHHNEKNGDNFNENNRFQSPHRDLKYAENYIGNRQGNGPNRSPVGSSDSLSITTPMNDIPLGSNNNFVWNVHFDYNTDVVEEDNFEINDDIDFIKELKDLKIDYKPDGYNPKSEHFHYTMESMIKLFLFKRLKRIRWNTTLAEILNKNDNDIRHTLGFNGHIPARNTIGYFSNHYLGVEGHQDFYDKTLQDLKRLMDTRGIKFGERVGIDSTPLPTAKYDPIGEINPHYNDTMGIYKMVKIHILSCLDTNIPIAITFSSGTAHDSQFLIPLIEKAKSLGFSIKECYADGAYDSTEHWAELTVKHGIDCYFTIRENAVEHADSTKHRIIKRYQKYHEHPDWIQTNDFDTILKFMLKVGETKRIGNHFRNAWVRTMKYHEYEYQAKMGERSKCENLHSILKEQMLFEKNFEGKGWPKIKIHTFQFMITMIMIATIKANCGLREGFNKISESMCE